MTALAVYFVPAREDDEERAREMDERGMVVGRRAFGDLLMRRGWCGRVSRLSLDSSLRPTQEGVARGSRGC